MTALERFALQTLRRMEISEEWSLDLLDEMSAEARELGLAALDSEGYFRLTCAAEHLFAFAENAAPDSAGADRTENA